MSSNNFIKSGNKWVTVEGKEVILMEPDVPWYINMGPRKPIGLIKNKYIKLNDVEYKNADFKSNFVINPQRQDMGYGYSLADRQGEPCLCKGGCNKSTIEGFCGGECLNKMNEVNAKILLGLFLMALVFHALGKQN